MNDKNMEINRVCMMVGPLLPEILPSMLDPKKMATPQEIQTRLQAIIPICFASVRMIEATAMNAPNEGGNHGYRR